jgi:hypothetical protein
MCEPKIKITAGAMLVAALSPRVVLGGMAVLGSGVALVAALGSGAPAFLWMGAILWASVTTIELLRRRANPVQRVVYAQPRTQQRTRVELVTARRAPELEAGAPAVTYTVTEQQRTVR